MISEGSSGSLPVLQNQDFKIVVELKTPQQQGQVRQAGFITNSTTTVTWKFLQVVIHLLAPTVQEKAAWISDISQCLDNVQYNDMIRPNILDNSSVSIPLSIKNDPKLFKDEADIRFSRTLNSCKVPQIRYATPERLLQRLTGKLIIGP